jgi:hypothetical protein
MMNCNVSAIDAQHMDEYAASEDSILPMTLVRSGIPSERECAALDSIYQTAAMVPWVQTLGESDDVPQATDLNTALRYCLRDDRRALWTRGLLVQVSLYIHV